MIVRRVYRATLMAADRLERVAIEHRRLSRAGLLRAAPVQDDRVSSGAAHLRDAVRWHFKQRSAVFEESEQEEALEEAFWCLRWAESRVAALSSASWVPRPVRVRHRVGELVENAEGKRGVVVGWAGAYPGGAGPSDERPALARGLHQPFYNVLFDGGSEPELVAQESVARVLASLIRSDQAPVRHEMLERFFYRFVPERGFYIPLETLALDFPEG